MTEQLDARPDWTRAAAWAASAVLGGIVLLHAALLPGGRWDGDEYFNFAKLRDLGWGFAWRRLIEWSPRPVSEAVLWLYDGAVTLADRPLIAPFLAVLWLALVGGCVRALWRPRTAAAPWRLAAALALPAMFLLGHTVNEMFYWPMAAAPYLLALTGASVLTLRLAAGAQTPRARRACALALLLAAGSAEVGLFFALGFAAALAVLEWRGALRARLWYLAPGAAAAALAVLLLCFRAGNPADGVVRDAASFHQAPVSLWHALLSLPPDLAGPDPYRPGPGTAGVVATWALLLLGLALALRVGLPAPAPRRPLLAVCAGVVASVYGSAAAAQYQFGMLCCERQHTFRGCLVVLLLVAVARLAGPKLPPPSAATRLLGAVLLVAATGIGLATRLPAIAHDFGLLRADDQVRQQNWAALHDNAPLVFRLPARGAVIEGLVWQPGRYRRDGTAPWFVDAMLMYFRRAEGEIVPTASPP